MDEFHPIWESGETVDPAVHHPSLPESCLVCPSCGAPVLGERDTCAACSTKFKRFSSNLHLPTRAQWEFENPRHGAQAWGYVKWFNEERGYGFVTGSPAGRDLFIHFSEIQMEGTRSLVAGEPVIFRRDYTGTVAPSAKEIVPIERGATTQHAFVLEPDGSIRYLPCLVGPQHSLAIRSENIEGVWSAAALKNVSVSEDAADGLVPSGRNTRT